MPTIHVSSHLNRRQLFKVCAAGAVGPRLTRAGFARRHPVSGGTVRDRLWVFACPVNSDFPNVGVRSVMTPAESAFFLGVPNIIMVQCYPRPGRDDRFKPFEPPFEQYATALRPLRRVVWSVVGGGGLTASEERKQVLELALRTPNFVGLFMDDFFTGRKEGKLASLTLEELGAVRRQATGSEKKLDIYVTLYTRFLELPLADYLNMIDVATLWTGEPKDLVNLEAYLSQAEKLAPNIRKMLGCYVVDYKQKKSIPVSAMQHQCETGLRWLRQGRIEGIIFLGNTVMDLGYEAVEWTRAWIQKVGDSSL